MIVRDYLIISNVYMQCNACWHSRVNSGISGTLTSLGGLVLNFVAEVLDCRGVLLMAIDCRLLVVRSHARGKGRKTVPMGSPMRRSARSSAFFRTTLDCHGAWEIAPANGALKISISRCRS